jgi:Xaa-Pro dipeptidase
MPVVMAGIDTTNLFKLAAAEDHAADRGTRDARCRPSARHKRRRRSSAPGSRGLSGVVLFDGTYVLYYVGFAFIPTERPIAFALSAEGEAATVVPRLEVEHAQEQPGIDRVEYYDEYPGEPRAEVAPKRTLGALGVGGRIGADQDGYPWILGYRGPSLSELVEAEVVRVGPAVEEQMPSRAPRRWR